MFQVKISTKIYHLTTFGFKLIKIQNMLLNQKLEKTDKEIDQMVYELYGLTEEEIKIVEGEE